MTRLSRHRPSPALIISFIALLVAMTGTGYAAITLPKNSVGTRQLKNNAVTTAKVKNGSLLSSDFKAGQLPAGARGLQGAQGPAGLQGPRGAQGPPGAAANVRLTTADGGAVPVSTGDSGIAASASCPAGMFAIGGGGVTQNGNAVLTDSFADSVSPAPATTWTVFYRNDSGAADSVVATVVCAAT
jgi:hypothetical protein